MSVLVWSAYILLAAVELYIFFVFIRRKERALLKAVMPVFLLFTAFLLFAHFMRFRIPDAVIILSMLSVLSHTFLGYFLRLYERTKIFDRINHAFSCFSFAPLAYFCLTSLFNEAIPELLAAIIIASLGITLGVFTEIIEFASDSRKKKEIKLQKGLKDTNFDLISDVIGSAMGGAFSYFILL